MDGNTDEAAALTRARTRSGRGRSGIFGLGLVTAAFACVVGAQRASETERAKKVATGLVKRKLTTDITLTTPQR